MAAIVYLIPILAITIVNAFKHLVGEFEARELALELHISGITMMTPLPLFRPEMVDILMFIVIVSSMMLIITGAFYMKNMDNPRKTSCERMAMAVGAIIFGLSTVLTFVLS